MWSVTELTYPRGMVLRIEPHYYFYIEIWHQPTCIIIIFLHIIFATSFPSDATSISSPNFISLLFFYRCHRQIYSIRSKATLIMWASQWVAINGPWWVGPFRMSAQKIIVYYILSKDSYYSITSYKYAHIYCGRGGGLCRLPSRKDSSRLFLKGGGREEGREGER